MPHFEDFFVHVHLSSACTTYYCRVTNASVFASAPGTWHVSSTSASGHSYQHLSSPLASVPILSLLLHHCSGSGSCTEHARRSCSLWMEQSGEEEEKDEKGGGERTAERESHRSRTPHGEAVAALRTRASWEGLSLTAQMEGILKTGMLDFDHQRGEDMR